MVFRLLFLSHLKLLLTCEHLGVDIVLEAQIVMLKLKSRHCHFVYVGVIFRHDRVYLWSLLIGHHSVCRLQIRVLKRLKIGPVVVGGHAERHRCDRRVATVSNIIWRSHSELSVLQFFFVHYFCFYLISY